VSPHKTNEAVPTEENAVAPCDDRQPIQIPVQPHERVAVSMAADQTNLLFNDLAHLGEQQLKYLNENSVVEKYDPPSANLDVCIDNFNLYDHDSTGVLHDSTAITGFLSKLVGRAVEESETSALVEQWKRKRAVEEEESEPSLLQLLQLGREWQVDLLAFRCPFALAWWGTKRQRPPTESRPMTLAELRQVRLEIDHRCTRENWSNTWDGETLAPETVSLYDFAHYAILPQTVPAGVLLDGLSDQQLQQWNAGTVISQCGLDQKR